MATSADHPVLPGVTSPVKGVSVATGVSLSCLPRHSRQSSGNYPDIVDSESCFQPVISNSTDDLCSAMAISNELSVQQIQPSTPVSNPAMLESGTYRPLSDTNVPNQRASTSSGDDLFNGSDSVRLLRETPSIDVIQRNIEPPPYRADSNPIRTHDLNVGVTGRLDNQRGEAIPDILFSHMVPQVPPSRPNQHRQPNRANNDRGGRRRVDNPVRHHSRNHQRDNRQSHANRRSRTQLHMYSQQRETCKEPCLKCLSSVTSFKCLLVLLSLIGVCCVIAGIVLGALHAVAPGSFLFLAIMFLGLGILLVVVVFVGWRCTPRGHEPCHALFGLGDHRRHRRRHGARGHRPRDGNWYGGILYPEFGHRRPPPSYAASMQEYQQQLALAQQQYLESVNTDNLSLPSSPPPTYRSHVSVRPGIPITFPANQQGQYPTSRPPTYRSRTSTLARPALPLDRAEGEGSDIQMSDSNTAESTNHTPETVNSVSVGTSAVIAQAGVNQTPTSHEQNSSGVTGEMPHCSGATSSTGHTHSTHQSPSSSHSSEESVENLLETTLRTFEEITNSVINTEPDSQCVSSAVTDSPSVNPPLEPHTNSVTSQTTL